MKVNNSIRVVLTALLFLLGSSSVSFAQRGNADFDRGRADAAADLNRGIYKVNFFHDDGVSMRPDCDFPSLDEVYQSILQERYKIEIRSVAVSDPGDLDVIRDYANGYNSVSKPVIKSIYGDAFFVQATGEAKTEFEIRHAAQQRKCQLGRKI
ncbi:MAG TPA: hypothetical protein VJT71_13320 [Pyrinomonadaceae bacterium]|nr:hypothetical protein [Pyrinomonadaceae bacterium]